MSERGAQLLGINRYTEDVSLAIFLPFDKFDHSVIVRDAIIAELLFVGVVRL